MSSVLFEQFDLGNLKLVNRVVIPPMCMYSAAQGQAQDWHLMHWGNLLNSGAAMLFIEATAVSPEGRITNNCLGLWDDVTQQELGDKLERARRLGPNTPICLQLAHAGRKASSAVPWEGGALILPDEGGWQTLAPSAVPHLPDEPAPAMLTLEGIAKLVASFKDAAARAQALGIEAVEVHAAHGYLLHQFLSPLSNTRTDSYGGSFENRIRFPLEVFNAVREVFDGVVGVRVSATDWVEGGWTPEETALFSGRVRDGGGDFVHVSSAGVSPLQKIKVVPGFQVPYARQIKIKSGMPTIAVGLITDPNHAEEVVSSGDADLVAIGRGILYDPRWVWHAAAALGGQVMGSAQYWRSPPIESAQLFRGAHSGAR